jgi:hypothetical protein
MGLRTLPAADPSEAKVREKGPGSRRAVRPSSPCQPRTLAQDLLDSPKEGKAQVDDYYSLVGTLLFVAFLAFLFLRLILGYATPPIPARAYDAWTTSARALKGRFSPAVGIQHSRIDFLLSGRTAFLQFIVTNARSLKGRTAIRVNVVGLSPGYLTLKSKGRKTIRAGSAPRDPEFDDWFVRARALPQTLASELISPRTKAKLTLPLLSLRRFGATTIDLGKESLSLELESLLVEESPQIELASAMGTMMECFFGSASAFPIELVEVPNPECARCAVCGCELREQIVRCVACQTPHHDDCWRFNMRCSTYGCGETRCFR